MRSNPNLTNLKEQYDAMVKKFEDNQLIYGAKFSFEPIVGEIYHLYKGHKDGQPFLSVIDPSECSWDFVGTYRLTSEKLWEEKED